MEKEYVVKLTPKERQKLRAVVNKGQNKAAVIRRAHILLKSDEGKSDEGKSDEGKSDRMIGELQYIHEDSVRNTRKRFVEDGLVAALEDKTGPPRETKLNEQQQAHLVAVACSKPPEGQARWTLELLVAQLVKDGVVEGISPETVRLALKKTI
jgi:transposase